MGKLLHYTMGSLLRPKQTFKELMADKKQLTYAWQITGIDCILWAGLMLANFLLDLEPHGDRIVITQIPDKTYFLIIALICVPVTLGGVAMIIGFVMMFSRFFKAKSPFDQTFSTLCFALNLPMLLGWTFEFALTINLILTGSIQPHGYQSLIAIAGYIVIVIGSYILATFAVMASHKMSWWKSFIVVFAAMLFYGGLAVTYLS